MQFFPVQRRQLDIDPAISGTAISTRLISATMASFLGHFTVVRARVRLTRSFSRRHPESFQIQQTRFSARDPDEFEDLSNFLLIDHDDDLPCHVVFSILHHRRNLSVLMTLDLDSLLASLHGCFLVNHATRCGSSCCNRRNQNPLHRPSFNSCNSCRVICENHTPGPAWRSGPGRNIRNEGLQRADWDVP